MAEYNGWTNYETWAVNLWLGNDEAQYRHWSQEAQSAWDDATADRTFTREENAAIALVEMLETYHDENIPSGIDGTVYADLLSAALSEVNWKEIADGLLESVDKEEGKEEEVTK